MADEDEEHPDDDASTSDDKEDEGKINDPLTQSDAEPPQTPWGMKEPWE